MSSVCVIHHNLLIVICFLVPALFQQLHIVVQKDADNASSTAWAAWGVYHAHRQHELIKIIETWKNTEYRYRYRGILKYRYQIPNRLLKYRKYRKTDTDFKYRHRLITSGGSDVVRCYSKPNYLIVVVIRRFSDI